MPEGKSYWKSVSAQLANGVKTVSIPARVGKGGHLHYMYGGPLPKLKEGAIVQITAAEMDVESAEDCRVMTQDERVCLLPAGCATHLVVKPRGPLPANLAAAIQEADYLEPPQRVVAVLPAADQKLVLRGTKLAQLLDCEWTIPSLSRKASSLNEAYRLVSEAFEPHRRSHAGNVFKLAWCYVGNEWVGLEQLLDRTEADCERQLVIPRLPIDFCLFETRATGPSGIRDSVWCRRADDDTWEMWSEPDDHRGHVRGIKNASAFADEYFARVARLNVDRTRGASWNALVASVLEEDAFLGFELQALGAAERVARRSHPEAKALREAK